MSFTGYFKFLEEYDPAIFISEILSVSILVFMILMYYKLTKSEDKMSVIAKRFAYASFASIALVISIFAGLGFADLLSPASGKGFINPLFLVISAIYYGGGSKWYGLFYIGGAHIIGMIIAISLFLIIDILTMDSISIKNYFIRPKMQNEQFIAKKLGMTFVTKIIINAISSFLVFMAITAVFTTNPTSYDFHTAFKVIVVGLIIFATTIIFSEKYKSYYNPILIISNGVIKLINREITLIDIVNGTTQFVVSFAMASIVGVIFKSARDNQLFIH